MCETRKQPVAQEQHRQKKVGGPVFIRLAMFFSPRECFVSVTEWYLHFCIQAQRVPPASSLGKAGSISSISTFTLPEARCNGRALAGG